MKTHSHKIGRGQPRYDGLGARLSAVGLHAGDLHAARDADAALMPDGWGQWYFTPALGPAPADDSTALSTVAPALP